MASIYLLMTLELVHILFMVTIFSLMMRKFFQEKNRLDMAFVGVLLQSTALVIYNAYINISSALGYTNNRVFVGHLELSVVFGLLSSAAYFWFLINLIPKMKLFDSLSPIASIFIIIYGYYKPIDLFCSIYLGITFIPGSIALIIYSIRKKNGLSFTIGLAVVMFLFTDTFISPEIIAVYYSLEYVVMTILILGIVGIWDKYVFYDRKYRKEISNSWIAGRIGAK